MTATRVPDDGKLHGPEIDLALEWAETHTPPFLGLCLAALGGRTEEVIARQLEAGVDPEEIRNAAKLLMDAGQPFDHDTAAGLTMRSAIGGTFTMGIATGMRLAAMMTPERLQEIVVAAGEEA